jgi:hypothetical protein
MGFQDQAEQPLPRPCREMNGRPKRTYELTSSVVPRGTSFHRWVEHHERQEKAVKFRELDGHCVMRHGSRRHWHATIHAHEIKPAQRENGAQIGARSNR